MDEIKKAITLKNPIKNGNNTQQNDNSLWKFIVDEALEMFTLKRGNVRLQNMRPQKHETNNQLLSANYLFITIEWRGIGIQQFLFHILCEYECRDL